MVFAIPLNVLDTAGFWLRMWVINASAGLAHVAGIGVLQSGTQLLAPDGRYQYDVAAACSGVRSLTALAALSLLAGYLNFRAWWRRGAALLLCFPLVYVGNVARISSIVFAAQLGGQAWGERAHTVMGYGVFVIVLGGVLAAVGAILRWWPEPPLAVANEKDRIAKEESARAGGGPRAVWLVAVLVVGLAGGEIFFLHALATMPARGAAGVVLAADGKNPAALPEFLGIEWTGRAVPVSPVEREILPPDTGFSRKIFFNHRDPSKQVFVSIVLSGRDRTSIHRPELCLVGQGWTITGRTEHAFQFPQRADAKFSASLLRVRREMPSPTTTGQPVAVPQLTAYWFVSGDAVVATHWELFAHDAWNRVAHARADRWAYVLLQTDASDGEPAALARIQAVLDATLPAFQRPLDGRR
jgi:EpsI family protein